MLSVKLNNTETKRKTYKKITSDNCFCRELTCSKFANKISRGLRRPYP